MKKAQTNGGRSINMDYSFFSNPADKKMPAIPEETTEV
jgi:hypothetical protein